MNMLNISNFSDSKISGIKIALIILMTLAAYIPAMKGGYIWDDDAYIINNRHIRTIEGLRQIWFNIKSEPQYYPMVHTGFWIEYHLWQLNPFGYHVVNIILHILNAILLWIILRKLEIPAAWMAAAVFALHPVHVESAAWITERKNTLSGFFYLCSVITFLRFAKIGIIASHDNTRENSGLPDNQEYDRKFFGPALILYLSALFSKTVTCSLPAVFFLILWWKRGYINWKRDVFIFMPFFLMGAGFGLMTAWMEKHHVYALGEEWSLSFSEKILVAGRSLWFYAGKLLFPYKLTFIYPRWEINSGIWWQYLFPLLALALFFVLWILRDKIGKAPLAALLFFTGTLTPALGFFNVYPHRYSFVADHFQYLASIGLIVLILSVAAKIFQKYNDCLYQKIIRTAFCMILLIMLGIQTWNQGHIYKDSETLWLDTIAKNPGAWMAHNNLGTLLAQQGRLKDAVYHFSEALRINPEHAGAHLNMGIALDTLGKYDEAIQHFSDVLRIKPDSAEAHINIGLTLYNLGKLNEAVRHFSEALRINPESAQVHVSIGNALDNMGSSKEAVLHYLKALQIKPDYAEANMNLGITLMKQGNFKDAGRHFSEVLRIKPGYKDAEANLEFCLNIINNHTVPILEHGNGMK